MKNGQHCGLIFNVPAGVETGKKISRIAIREIGLNCLAVFDVPGFRISFNKRDFQHATGGMPEIYLQCII